MAVMNLAQGVPNDERVIRPTLRGSEPEFLGNFDRDWVFAPLKAFFSDILDKNRGSKFCR